MLLQLGWFLCYLNLKIVKLVHFFSVLTILFKKIIISTVFAFNLLLFCLTSPALGTTCSQGTDVAGIDKYFFAMLCNFGKTAAGLDQYLSGSFHLGR